jgi:hypothetical protein
MEVGYRIFVVGLLNCPLVPLNQNMVVKLTVIQIRSQLRSCPHPLQHSILASCWGCLQAWVVQILVLLVPQVILFRRMVPVKVAAYLQRKADKLSV